MEFPSPKSDDLLTFAGVTLDYGQFRALNDIHFAIGASTIHAIVGEHGAGKSSLAMILNGLVKPQSGLIRFDRREYRALTVELSFQAGIRTVHQHALSLHEHFSVAENLFLTSGRFFERLSWRYKIYQRAQAFLRDYAVDIAPSTLVKDLSLSDRILVDMLKQISGRPKLLILDEALEKLSSVSLKKAVNMLVRLKEAGMAVLLITHRIDDIYELADMVSVMKNGEVLVTDRVRNIDKLNLIKMAYIQLSDEEHVGNLNREFYQLLKYNEAILRHLPVNLIVMDDARRNGRMLSEFEVLNWARQLCDALEYMHTQETPVLHRDIKPGNIRLAPSGVIKLVDFGLVKLVGKDDSRTITVLQGRGTAAYTPLEQYGEDDAHTDARSDIYSLGGTLYHLLTNQAPAEAKQRFLKPAALQPMRELNPAVSERVETAVMQAIAMHPDDRPATVAEFRDRLFGEGKPVAQNKAPSASAADVIRANAVWIALALVAALAGLLVSLR